MPRTEFSPSIASRPTYAPLRPHGAAPALMLADAEGALTRYRLGLDALDRQRASIDAARRSYGFSMDRYEAGDISLLELLDAERALREAESAYARTHTAVATELVALYKALGGGWPATASAS